MSQDHNYSPHKLCISQQLMQGQSFFSTKKCLKPFQYEQNKYLPPGYTRVRKEIASDAHLQVENVKYKRNLITCVMSIRDPRVRMKEKRKSLLDQCSFSTLRYSIKNTITFKSFNQH